MAVRRKNAIVRLGVTLGLAALAVALGSLLRPEGPRATGSSGASGKEGRLPKRRKPRRSILRSRPGPVPWVFFGKGARSSMASYEAVLEAAVDAHAELRAGRTEWSDTLIELEATAEAFEIARECSDAHLAPEEVCEYTLDRVLEPDPDGGRWGSVAFARARASEGASEGCAAYAACVAEFQAGRPVPLPPGADEPLGLTWTTRDARNDPVFRNIEPLRREIAMMAEDLEAARAMEPPPDRPDWAYVLAHEAADLEWRMALLEELEEAEEKP